MAAFFLSFFAKTFTQCFTHAPPNSIQRPFSTASMVLLKRNSFVFPNVCAEWMNELLLALPNGSLFLSFTQARKFNFNLSSLSRLSFSFLLPPQLPSQLFFVLQRERQRFSSFDNKAIKMGIEISVCSQVFLSEICHSTRFFFFILVMKAFFPFSKIILNSWVRP